MRYRKGAVFAMLVLCLLVGGASADTTLFYPPSTNADARLGYSGASVNWATLLPSNGNQLANTTANVSAITLATGTAWNTLLGYGASFDTSSLNGKVIDSATFGLYGDGIKVDQLGGMNVTIIAYTPPNPAVLQNSDWQTRTRATKYSAPMAYATWGNQYNNFSIDVSAINTGGYSNLLATTGWDAYGTNPAFSASKVSKLGVYDSSKGDGYKPFLEVTWHESEDTTPPNSVSPITNSTPTCKKIDWDWTQGGDVAGVMVYKDGTFLHNVTTSYDNWTGLTEGVPYTISTRSYDSSNNVNASWVNATATIVSETCPRVLVMVGDSITEGLYTTHNGIKGYGGYIKDDQPSWLIYNAGYSGEDTDNMVSRYTTEVSDRSADYVIYEVGNDISHGDSFETIVAKFLNYNNMAAANGTTVYLNTVPPRSGTYAFNGTKLAIRNQLNSWIRCNFTPDHSDRYFIDLDELLAANDTHLIDAYTYDGTHPSDAGYQRWGEAIDSSFPNNDTSVCRPIASFTSNTTEVCNGSFVQFTDTSTGSPVWWNWSFGGANISALQNPTFQYNETGLFEVDLKAINAYGSDWENKTAYINVSSVFCPAPPVPETACFNQTGNITVSLESRSQTSMKWNWNATENITVLSVDSIFRYFDPAVGNFTVSGFLPSSYHIIRISNLTDFGMLNCTTNATPPAPWQPEIMPSTEQNFDLTALWGYWWVPVIVFVAWILFRRK